MNQDLQRIRGFVRALVRRERAVVAGRVVLQLIMLGAAAVLLGVIAAWAQWDRPTAYAAMVGLVGIGLWAVGVLPFLLRWQQAGDVLRQAKLVEVGVPELRGRLITAVQRTGGAIGAESPQLVGLLARRTVGVLQNRSPSQVHSFWPLLGWSGAAGMASMVSLLGLLVSPGGVFGTIEWWMVSGGRDGAGEGFTAADDSKARVGDIVLRYTYPEYTGLDPREVENSTGDAMGPPGTVVQVFARSDQPVEAGALVAYDQPALDADVGEGGRMLSGTFTIEKDEGTWHLVTYRDGQPSSSRDFLITPEPDLPPEVIIETDDEIEVAADERIGVPWRARDDFGVDRVMLELDGTERGKPINRQHGRKAEVWGMLDVSPRQLGLGEGDSVRLSIVGWDNDTYSGSKAGRSREVVIRVLGETGLDQRDDERQTQLRDLMLDVLADFLEEPWPPGVTGGELARWGEELAHRYERLEDMVEAYERSSRRNQLEADVLGSVTKSGSELIRYTQVAFTPGSTEIPGDTAWDMTVELRDEAIESLEDGIINLDGLIKKRAFKKVVDKAAELADMATEMRQMLEADTPDSLEMLAQLDVLERKLAEMQKASAKLENGGLKEFVNARTDEMQSLTDEIREAISQGDMETAKKLMERLEQSMRETSEWMEDELDRMQSQGNEAMEQAQSLTEELAAIEAEQRSLQEQTAKLREEADKERAERVAQLWEELEQKTGELSEKGWKYAEQLESAERDFYEQERAKQATEEADRMHESVGARDLRGAQKGVGDTRAAWNRSDYTMERERQRRGGQLKGPGRREMAELQKLVEEAEAILDKLEKESRMTDPSTRRQARQLQQQQQQLQQRLQQAEQQAQQVMREFPVRPDGLEEALDDANQQMGQSGQELQDGKPMPSEGAQGMAAQRLKDAQDALKQAMQQAAEQQQQLQEGQGQGQGEPKDGESGGRESGQNERFDTQDMQITSDEDDFSAEEYRRQLLEGMEGDVPEEYRSWKKRYFEELVRQ